MAYSKTDLLKGNEQFDVNKLNINVYKIHILLFAAHNSRRGSTKFWFIGSNQSRSVIESKQMQNISKLIVNQSLDKVRYSREKTLYW